MSFVLRIIGPDERLIGLSGAHWVYAAKGGLWFFFFATLGYGAREAVYTYLVQGMGLASYAPMGPILFDTGVVIGGVLLFFHLLTMISIEVALTTKRVIYKRGFIAVDVREVDLEEIKAADVNNGWLGRFLDYGYLVLDARFVTNLVLPAIGNPYRFVKALNVRRAELRSDTMKVVLNEYPQRGTALPHAAPRFEPPILDVTPYGTEIQPPPARPVRLLSPHRNVEKMRPVVFDKAGLRQKAKDCFHMIAHYGRKF